MASRPGSRAARRGARRRLADAELKLRLGGDTQEAERELREVLADAGEAGDRITAARARVALGLAASQRGDHLEAVELLEKTLSEHRLDPHSHPDVYATLGYSYGALGAPDRAVRIFEQCLAEVTDTDPGDVHVQIRFATYLSYALTDTGDYQRAAEVVKDALARAKGDPDPYSRVRLYWSMARLSGLAGRTREALVYIRRAIALLETTEDTTYLARAYMLAAGVEVTEAKNMDAQRHLELAERLIGRTPQRSDLGMLRIAQGRLALGEGDAARAVAYARDAIDALGDYHGGEQGEAVWTLAKGLAATRELVGAADAYTRAIDLLALNGRPNEAAEACVEWAELLTAAGRETEADDALRRAGNLRDQRTNRARQPHTR